MASLGMGIVVAKGCYEICCSIARLHETLAVQQSEVSCLTSRVVFLKSCFDRSYKEGRMAELKGDIYQGKFDAMEKTLQEAEAFAVKFVDQPQSTFGRVFKWGKTAVKTAVLGKYKKRIQQYNEKIAFFLQDMQFATTADIQKRSDEEAALRERHMAEVGEQLAEMAAAAAAGTSAAQDVRGDIEAFRNDLALDLRDAVNEILLSAVDGTDLEELRGELARDMEGLQAAMEAHFQTLPGREEMQAMMQAMSATLATALHDMNALCAKGFAAVQQTLADLHDKADAHVAQLNALAGGMSAVDARVAGVAQGVHALGGATGSLQASHGLTAGQHGRSNYRRRGRPA